MVKRVVLATKLDTSAAAGLRTSLIAARDEDVVVDGSEVEMLGALCLETLMSAAVLWKRAGLELTFENLSGQMQDDLGRYGLTPDALLEYAA